MEKVRVGNLVLEVFERRICAGEEEAEQEWSIEVASRTSTVTAMGMTW